VEAAQQALKMPKPPFSLDTFICNQCTAGASLRVHSSQSLLFYSILRVAQSWTSISGELCSSVCSLLDDTKDKEIIIVHSFLCHHGSRESIL